MQSKKLYPKSGTAKRTALGSFMNTLGQIIRALEQIIFVPLFLWAWSKALYGEWIVLFSIVGYFSISGLGMGTYITNKMTQLYSKGKLKEYAKVLKSAFGIYSVITLILFAGLVIFSFAAPFLEWFNIEIAGEMSVRFSVLILGSYILFGTLLSLPNNLYITTGEYPRYGAIANIKELLLIGFVVLVLVSGGHFVAVSLIYLVVLLGFTLVILFDALRRHPEINLREAKIDWKMAISFIAPGLVFLLIPFSNMLYLQGSVLIISASLGAVAVATFGVHRTLANLIQRFTSIINPAIRPELTASEARKEYGKIQLIHRFFTKIILLISTGLSVFLLFTGQDIIRIWTGGKIAFQPTLWILFLILIPILAFWNFSSTFQVATNKYNKLALSRIISSVAGLILAIILVKPLGMTGVLLGFLIAEAGLNLWFIPYNTLKIIKDSKRKFLLSIIKGIPMIGLELLGGWLIVGLFENVWFKVIGVAVSVGLIGSFYTYFLWLDKKERSITNDFIKRSKNKFLRKLTN